MNDMDVRFTWSEAKRASNLMKHQTRMNAVLRAFRDASI
jgi:uncharacterized DUF497 family protein